MFHVGRFHSLKGIGSGFPNLSFEQFCFWVLGDYAVVFLWIGGFLSVSLSFTDLFFAIFSYISLPLLAIYCYLDMRKYSECAVSQRIKDFCSIFVLYLYCHKISENCLDLSH